MIPTLSEFWDQLDRHDWFHEMSDDIRVDRAGNVEWNRLNALAKAGGDEYVKLLRAFARHVYSGPPWPTPKSPKPERPT